MFKGLLKKYIFVLCATLSSTACLAMEPDKEDISTAQFKRYLQNRFDNEDPQKTFLSIIDDLAVHQKRGKGPEYLARIFKLWPDKIEFFEANFENENFYFSPTGSTIEQLKNNERDFLESLCFLPKASQDIIRQLNVATLNNLGYRSLNFGAKSEDRSQMIKFVDMAIWYSIMGAKTGCEYSYFRLKNTIEFEIDNKKRYTPYYTFLIPLLMQEDEQAQMLFAKVCMDCEGALKWMESYIEKLGKNDKKEARSQQKVLRDILKKFEKEKAIQQYNNAQQLWKSSPSKAIDLMLESQNNCTEAKEKLVQLRQSKGYLNPKKVKDRDHGRLLKEKEVKRGNVAFQNYSIGYKRHQALYKENLRYGPDLALLMSFLKLALDSGNSQAIQEHRRLEKLAEKSSDSTNFDSTFAKNYLAFIRLQERFCPNTASIHHNPQKAISQQTTKSSSTCTKNSPPTTPKDVKHSGKSQTVLTNLSFPQETPQSNQTSTVNNNETTTSMKRLEKPEYPTDVALLREYKELENSRNLVTSTPVLSTAKTNNNSPQPMTSPKEDSSSQSKPSFEGVVLQKIDIQADALSFPEKTKNVQIKEKENKTELPLSSSITNDQAPNQSLEEGQDSVNVSLKPRRTLQRTQSLVTLPSSAEKEKNIPFAKPKRILNRTLSLNGSDFPVHNAKESKKASSDENKNSPSENMKTKHPSKKFSFKTHKLFKKKEKAEKNQETMKQSSSSTKTSSSKSVSEEQFSKSREHASKSEEKFSKSEDSLSTSKEKVAFSKFIRALEGAQTKKDVKLSAGTITSTLKQLNNVTYKKNGNTISATHNLNSEIHLTLHTHDDSGTLWYKKPENVEHFLWFVGECNPDLKDQIYKIGKK